MRKKTFCHKGKNAQGPQKSVQPSGAGALPGYQSQDTQISVPQIGLPNRATTQTAPTPPPNKATKPCLSAHRVGGVTSGPGPTPYQAPFSRGGEVALMLGPALQPRAQPSSPGPNPQPAPRLGGVTPYKKSSELPAAASSSKKLVQLGPELRNKESC